MADLLHGEPNRRIGSIEHVGNDGFIVEGDPSDPLFFDGKRLFTNFDDLLRFLAECLDVYKGPGNTYGMKGGPGTQAGTGKTTNTRNTSPEKVLGEGHGLTTAVGGF